MLGPDDSRLDLSLHRIRAVVFDLGETLLDETEMWGSWADRLGVPRFTFFAVAGALIERGQHPSRALELLGLGSQREAVLGTYRLGPGHLYPDAAPCLKRLRDLGFVTAVAGNQPADLQGQVAGLGLPVDVVTSSTELEAEKPDAEFFIRLAGRLGMQPGEAAYVGDRVDYDIVPAAGAGLATILVHRGPWAALQAARPEASRADAVVTSLDEVPDAMVGLERTTRPWPANS
jgi:FMN phosphatase YigB (HAD superfamily)